MEGAVFHQFKCQQLCLRKRVSISPKLSKTPNRFWVCSWGKRYGFRWKRNYGTNTSRCWSRAYLPAIKAATSSPSISDGGFAAPDYSVWKKKGKRIAGIDQDELVDPRHLADQDSCFCEFKGVHIHYKVSEQDSDMPTTAIGQALPQLPSNINQKIIGLPMVLLHGFGASAFSWNRVMKPLANVIGSKVIAFDRPAFGLTSRVSYSELANQIQANDGVKSINPYSMFFSVLSALHFIDLVASQKAVLVGHSAGSMIAVNTYFEAPERVAALILVAPAIVAPLLSAPRAKNNQSRQESQIRETDSASNRRNNAFVILRQALSKLYQYIAMTITRMLKGMMYMVNSLYLKVMSAVLRSAVAVTLVRIIIDKFGIAAVKNSWYNANEVTEDILHGYTKPLRTKGWDRALVEFTAAMLMDSAAESSPSLSERLHEIKCPVLIITGDTDRLVPPWNAERLSLVIPGSHFEVIKNCGHLPQEEKPEEFIAVVQRFLQSVLASSDPQSMQAPT